MKNLSFCDVSALHASLLHEMHQQIFVHQKWSEEDFVSLLSIPVMQGLLLTLDTHKELMPIGYLIWQECEHEAEIITFGILPAFQHKGYGQILYDAVESRLISEQIERIILDVSVSNRKAIQFYAKNGFSTFTIRPKYYREGDIQVDAQLMAKIIKTSA